MQMVAFIHLYVWLCVFMTIVICFEVHSKYGRCPIVSKKETKQKKKKKKQTKPQCFYAATTSSLSLVVCVVVVGVDMCAARSAQQCL